MNAMQLLKYVTKINAPLGAINLATTVYRKRDPKRNALRLHLHTFRKERAPPSSPQNRSERTKCPHLGLRPEQGRKLPLRKKFDKTKSPYDVDNINIGISAPITPNNS